MKIDIEHHRGSEPIPVSCHLHDEELGGVSSEHALAARLDQAIRFGQASGAAAVVAVDCTGFKALSHELGSEASERALGQVARRMRCHSGPGDLLARWGERGLALLLTGLAAPESAEAVAGVVAHDLSGAVDVDLHRVEIGACVGLAWSPQHGRTASAVVAAACEAAQAAAERGGDVYEVASSSRR